MASNSPYDGFENAVLTFTVRGTASTDPVTGNPIEATTTTAVDALLKIQRDPDWQGKQGIDLTRTWMEGNLVNPQFLPAGIALPARVPCIRAGVVGEFQLLPIIRDPWGVWEETGDPIKGYFYQGGYGSAAIAAPTITSYTPTSGPPGTQVTITGTNLGTVTSVTFGGSEAQIVSAFPTSLIVIVPNNAVDGTITVTNPGGSYAL